MNTATRLVTFTAGIAVVGAGAAVLGNATGATPPGGSASAHRDGHRSATPPATSGTRGAAAGQAATHDGMAGMGAGASTGLTLESLTDRLQAGRTVTWRFRVRDDAGRIVRSFDREQTKLAHLIVVRSDLTGYQHLHPELAADGTFSVPIAVERPGRYRAVVDVTTGDERSVLAADLTAPGDAADVPLPAPSAIAETDGYRVELHRAAPLVAGREARLTFTVTRDGRPVTGLQPYLGAYGHLVALHADDLAYAHVHAEGEDRDAGTITFDSGFAEAGAIRLFLQFRAAGEVRTVAFTQQISAR